MATWGISTPFSANVPKYIAMLATGRLNKLFSVIWFSIYSVLYIRSTVRMYIHSFFNFFSGNDGIPQRWGDRLFEKSQIWWLLCKLHSNRKKTKWGKTNYFFLEIWTSSKKWDKCSYMQYLDEPCTSKDLSELQNMAKSPRKRGAIYTICEFLEKLTCHICHDSRNSK